MGSIIDYVSAAAKSFSNRPTPKRKNDDKFDLHTFTTPQLKLLKKEINRELRNRMKGKFLGLWNKYKHKMYAILTLLVAIIGGIIIPILLNK